MPERRLPCQRNARRRRSWPAADRLPDRCSTSSLVSPPPPSTVPGTTETVRSTNPPRSTPMEPVHPRRSLPLRSGTFSRTGPPRPWKKIPPSGPRSINCEGPGTTWGASLPLQHLAFRPQKIRRRVQPTPLPRIRRARRLGPPPIGAPPTTTPPDITTIVIVVSRKVGPGPLPIPRDGGALVRCPRRPP